MIVTDRYDENQMVQHVIIKCACYVEKKSKNKSIMFEHGPIDW